MPVSFDSIRDRIKKLSENRHFRFGVPFFGFIALGVFMTRISQTVRYDAKSVHTLTRDDLREHGIEVPKWKPIEEIYEDMKEVGRRPWENKRVPRPWDEEEAAAATFAGSAAAAAAAAQTPAPARV